MVCGSAPFRGALPQTQNPPNDLGLLYTLVKAKALTGLAEIYWLQKDFDKSISHHFESIELLDRIAAKCDLAEAYFLLGLTYQAMEEHDQAKEYKDKSIEFFEQMEAPKQIERVKKAFGENI